jgi:hypothetical protein
MAGWITYQDSSVAVLEGNGWISCGDDGCETWSQPMEAAEVTYLLLHFSKGNEQSSSSMITPSKTPSIGEISSNDSTKGWANTRGLREL